MLTVLRQPQTSIGSFRAERPSANLPLGHFLILWAAFLNAMLRPGEDSDITLFRIMLPVALLFIALYDIAKLTYLLAIVLVLLLSQLMALQLSPYGFSQYNVSFLSNYLIMIVSATYIYILSVRFNKRSIDLCVTVYFYSLLFVLFLQYIMGFTLPNVPDAEGALNAWYGNENNASLSLAAFIFYAVRFGELRRHVWAASLAILIMAFNGSRTCLLVSAIVLFYAAYRQFGLLITGVIAALIFGGLLVYMEYSVADFSLVSEVYQFLSNLTDSFSVIINLEVNAGVISSLDVRATAAVLAIMDFAAHPIFGTGAGNTVALIEGNALIFNGVIKSVHNMPLMMLAELGIVGVSLLLFPLRRMSRVRLGEFVFWVTMYLFASLSQSGGFVTNFFVLTTFIIVLSRSTRAGPPSDRRRGKSHWDFKV